MEQSEEILEGNTFSSSWRLQAASVSHPPTHNIQECVTRPAPPRSLHIRREYNSICKTHKKLVKSGAVTCSVSLSTPPPTLDLPPAPTSPLPVLPLLEGSTHWGAVGDFSGVQTPGPSPVTVTPPVAQVPAVPAPGLRGVSVIRSAPPALPPRSTQLSTPALPPRPPHPSDLPPDIPTPISSRAGVIPKRLSSTDPLLLDQSDPPVPRRVLM